MSERQTYNLSCTAIFKAETKERVGTDAAQRSVAGDHIELARELIYPG